MASKLSTQHLSKRERALIREVCAGYADWAKGEPAAPDLLGTLGRGQSNTIALLKGVTGQWVLRLGREKPPAGVCREREAMVHGAAAASGFAPQLLWSDPARGVLLMQYTPSKRPVANPRDIAALLRRIHALPRAGTPLEPEHLLDDYRRTLAPGSLLAELLQYHAELVERVSSTLNSRHKQASVLCHNDLLDANRVWHAGRMLALDWEYARTGDACFDLAVCASQMTDEHAQTLLELYLGRTPQTQENQDYAAHRLAYKCIEACWHELFGLDKELCATLYHRLAASLAAEARSCR
ncbi:MAG: phosphotransferase [Congregibacter sp.]